MDSQLYNKVVVDITLSSWMGSVPATGFLYDFGSPGARDIVIITTLHTIQKNRDANGTTTALINQWSDCDITLTIKTETPNKEKVLFSNQNFKKHKVAYYPWVKLPNGDPRFDGDMCCASIKELDPGENIDSLSITALSDDNRDPGFTPDTDEPIKVFGCDARKIKDGNLFMNEYYENIFYTKFAGKVGFSGSPVFFPNREKNGKTLLAGMHCAGVNQNDEQGPVRQINAENLTKNIMGGQMQKTLSDKDIYTLAYNRDIAMGISATAIDALKAAYTSRPWK